VKPALLISIILIIVTACSRTAAPIAYDCPVIILPDDPAPLTASLTDESRPDEVIKAWVATAYAYRGWNQDVRQQIESSH